MFRRDIFVLVAVALIGIVMTIYVTFGQTPFFPKSLLTTMGDCPGWRGVIPPHRTVVMQEDEVGWLRNDLMSFHEEPIFQHKEQPERVVRFLLLPSDLPPVMVRTVESPQWPRSAHRQTAARNARVR